MPVSTCKSGTRNWGRQHFMGKATFPHLLQLLLFHCKDVSSPSGSTSPQSVTSALFLLLEPPNGTTEVDTESPTDFAGWAVVCERGGMRDLPHHLL